MGNKSFELNWPVVVLIIFIVGIAVVATVPEVWTRLEQTAVKVIQALSGLF